MARILVIDDERSLREFLSIMLHNDGHEVESAADGEAGIELLDGGDFDVVLTDLKMSGLSGMDVLRHTKGHAPSTQVIVLTAYGTTETAVQAMKEGAADYITKPFKVDELKVQLDKALELRELQKENLYLKEQLDRREGLGKLVGKSAAMRKVFDLIVRVAKTRTNVLITGPSGTGKELVARAIHQKGDSAKTPFVAVNCGAIPPTLIESELFGHTRGAFTGAVGDRPGVFEAAGAGTIFLDEIGELAPHMQVKLLRVLQERKVTRVGSHAEIDLNCRVIAATNQDLGEAVSAGRFREDLYYRLNVVQVRVPPLSERTEDIPLLVEHFVQKYREDLRSPVRGVTRAAMAQLSSHHYKGNIRELENIVQRAMALAQGEMIEVDALPPRLRDASLALKQSASLANGGVDLDAIIDEVERDCLLQALSRAHGVRKDAAELLGISFRSLRYRLNKHNIDGDGTS